MALAGARKRTRIRLIAVGAAALTAATVLVGVAFNDAIVFFHPPTELLQKAASGEIAPDRRVRLGGLVAAGSVDNAPDGSVLFTVTDTEADIPVRFDGVLPSLFREGQGVVAEGYFRNGRFEAADVLARHDENYVPKEVAEALRRSGQWKPETGAPPRVE
ncbi:MAG: cytochrome c maturation protein CcmE [Pseudomonadota bacterium]